MAKITVKYGQLCEHCGMRRDELLADGSSILYGQGLGHLIVTEDGKKFIAKKMIEEFMDDIIQVAAHVVSDPNLSTDSRAYGAARKLLSVITDIPETLRLA